MVANLVIFYKMTMILVYHSSIYPVCCLIVNFMKFSDFYLRFQKQEIKRLQLSTMLLQISLCNQCWQIMCLKLRRIVIYSTCDDDNMNSGDDCNENCQI